MVEDNLASEQPSQKRDTEERVWGVVEVNHLDPLEQAPEPGEVELEVGDRILGDETEKIGWRARKSESANLDAGNGLPSRLSRPPGGDHADVMAVRSEALS